MIETISSMGVHLCQIIRPGELPDRTAFYTPDAYSLQVGHIVHPEGHRIPRHVHVPAERHLIGTAEVLLVRCGRCEIDVYDQQRQLVATRELEEGDLLIMIAGGHGFRMLEDTVLLEVKQGPYMGPSEKEFF